MAAKKFSELREKMSPAAQAEVRVRADKIIQDMALAELRRARELTQQQLAGELKVNQAWISKIERQTDMYLSTLRAYIEAMGGELDIVARFDDGSVRINQLDEIDLPDQEPVGREPSFNVPGSHHSGSPDVRVVVYGPSQNPAIEGVEVWRSELGNTTGRSTTPDADTTQATSKAA